MTAKALVTFSILIYFLGLNCLFSYPASDKKSVNLTVFRSSRYWRNLIYTENASAHANARASTQIHCILFSRKRQFSKRSNLSKCFDYNYLRFLYFALCSVFTIYYPFVYDAKIAFIFNQNGKMIVFFGRGSHRRQKMPSVSPAYHIIP